MEAWRSSEVRVNSWRTGSQVKFKTLTQTLNSLVINAVPSSEQSHLLQCRSSSEQTLQCWPLMHVKCSSHDGVATWAQNQECISRRMLRLLLAIVISRACFKRCFKKILWPSTAISNFEFRQGNCYISQYQARSEGFLSTDTGCEAETLLRLSSLTLVWRQKIWMSSILLSQVHSLLNYG